MTCASCATHKHEHEPWGQKPDGSWATAEETAYPWPLARAIAVQVVIQRQAQRLACHLPSFAGMHVASNACGWMPLNQAMKNIYITHLRPESVKYCFSISLFLGSKMMGYISLIETAPNITSENKTPKFAARNLPPPPFFGSHDSGETFATKPPVGRPQIGVLVREPTPKQPLIQVQGSIPNIGSNVWYILPSRELRSPHPKGSLQR